MPALSPPRAFVQRLREYDRDLDCRWSDLRSCWLIERRVSDQNRLLGGQGHVDAEDHISAAAHKLILFEVDRNALDDRVVYTLWKSDIQRQGGADAVADRIDADYWAGRWKNKEEWRYFIRHTAREWFRYKNRPRVLSEKFAHTAPEGGMSICA